MQRASTGAMMGLRAQEQESVAGFVVVIAGRGVITAGPHSGAGKSSKLNLAPHGPFRVPACAPQSLIATAPPTLSSARRPLASQPGGRRTGVSSRGGGA